MTPEEYENKKELLLRSIEDLHEEISIIESLLNQDDQSTEVRNDIEYMLTDLDKRASEAIEALDKLDKDYYGVKHE